MKLSEMIHDKKVKSAWKKRKSAWKEVDCLGDAYLRAAQHKRKVKTLLLEAVARAHQIDLELNIHQRIPKQYRP
jgi:hypothetical protein